MEGEKAGKQAEAAEPYDEDPWIEELKLSIKEMQTKVIKKLKII